MGGQYQHFGNLHVFWSVGSIDSHVSNIIASQRFDAFIDCGGTVAVSVEADIAEVSLH